MTSPRAFEKIFYPERVDTDEEQIAAEANNSDLNFELTETLDKINEEDTQK
jgi:hypothetical protein